MSNKELFNKDNHKIELNTYENNFETFERKNDTEEWVGIKIFGKYDDAEEFILKRIDKKKKGTFKKKTPLPAIKRASSWNKTGHEHVKITSIDPTGYGCQCWVSDGKYRSKESYEYLLKDTEKNWSILDKLDKLRKEIEELENQREKFTDNELKAYFQEESE